jgi:hypothetical protein
LEVEGCRKYLKLPIFILEKIPQKSLKIPSKIPQNSLKIPQTNPEPVGKLYKKIQNVVY